MLFPPSFLASLGFCLIVLLGTSNVVAFAPQTAATRTSLWGVSYGDSRLYAAVSDGEALKIIIAGAPASGKGTQCEMIKEKYGVVHLSTGDMLRAAVAEQTEVGKMAKEYMDSGKLVPDDVIIGVVSDLWKVAVHLCQDHAFHCELITIGTSRWYL